MIKNQSILAKADIEVGDLMADGGYMQDQVSERFVRDLIEEAVALKLIKVMGLKSHTKILGKVGISGWVLKPGTSGSALPESDRVKPTTDEVELNTHLMRGEIRLNEEVLEDNIEGGQFKNTVMQMMSEHVALDMDKIVVNGDSTGTTGTPLDLMDGMLKSATSHIVAGGTVPIHKGMLKDAVKLMPKQYNRKKAAQRFLTSDDAETDYRDYLSDRATGLGDKYVTDDAPVRYGNRPIMPIPVFPDNLGGGTNCTNILLTDPKNAVWGVWRKIKMRTDVDITSGEWIMVTSVRAGFAWEEEDAVVKVTDVKTQ